MQFLVASLSDNRLDGPVDESAWRWMPAAMRELYHIAYVNLTARQLILYLCVDSDLNVCRGQSPAVGCQTTRHWASRVILGDGYLHEALL